jgi:hypothetical protein
LGQHFGVEVRNAWKRAEEAEGEQNKPMKAREFLQVDPATLHLPSSRRDGADPIKLLRQFSKHGTSMDGMPPPEVKRGSDGELVIFDGVTRATRIAKYVPGTSITVEVTGELAKAVADLPTVGEKL